MAKRILIFSLSYYPKHVGGAEVAIKEITDRIKPSDIEFHMVTLRYDLALPEIEQIGNVLVHRIGFARENPTPQDLKKWPLHLNKYLYQFWAYWKAHVLHLEYEYDGVWAMMAHSSAVPTALFNLSHHKVPFVLTLQEGDELAHIERLALPMWPLFKRAFTKATVVQAISTYLAQWAQRMGSECPLVVVPNGVDIQTFKNTYTKSELQILRRKHGVQHDNVLLITTSRLVQKNAIDVVIQALKELPENVFFLILGSGPEEEALHALAEGLGVTSRVLFMGQVAYNELPKYLAASDIFVRPSRSEGMGNSFIEAMTAGIPVIATQEGGLRDFIFGTVQNPDKKTTAWVVPKDNPQAIARAVQDIIDSPEQVAKVTQNAQEIVTGTYEWDIVAETMARDVFSKVV
jgi:glycosyltransferase involved in cell wall biosynthesis